MIHITLKCHNACANYYREPFGWCPHYLKIQSALNAMSEAMAEIDPICDASLGDSRAISPVTSKHWLGNCDFACKHYRVREGETPVASFQEYYENYGKIFQQQDVK